jgi:hypothetical protein
MPYCRSKIEGDTPADGGTPAVTGADDAAGDARMRAAVRRPYAAVRIPLAMLLRYASCVPFPRGTETRLRAHFAAASDKCGRGYDIHPRLRGQHRDGAPALPRGVAMLRSRTFGYAFALVHMHAGFGFLGAHKNEVRIYVSHLDSDEYVHVETAASLAAALRAVDRMYCQAADAHLP